MPALVFYGGFRTFLAGDDLGVFTAVALAIRLVQLIVVIAISIMQFGYFVRLKMTPAELLDTCGGGDITRPKLIYGAYEIAVVYMFSAWLTTIAGIVLEVLIWRAGSKGTPTHQDARAALKPLCCIKMIPLSLLRICNVLLALMVLFAIRNFCSCAGTTTDYLKMCPSYYTWKGWVGCLMVTHAMEASFVGIFAMCFLKKTVGRAPLPSCFKPETRWQVLCKCCCTFSALLTCCFYGGTDSSTTDFAEIGVIMADFFDSGGTLDVVISDIIMGIRLLARVQKLREDAAWKDLKKMVAADEWIRDNSDNDKECKDDDSRYEHANMAEWLVNMDPEQGLHPEAPLTTEDGGGLRANMKRKKSVVLQFQRDETKEHVTVHPAVRDVLSARNDQDTLAITEGARFIYLSNSIYEFKISVLQNSLTPSCCRIGESGNFGTTLGCTDITTFLGIPVGAGFKIAKHAESKLLQFVGLEDAAMELVYVQFGIGLARKPYCICLDHEWKSIVIAVRGTYSLDDIVADLTILPESMKHWGTQCGFDGEDCFVHSGMLRASAWIYNDLESHGILADLFQKPELSGYILRLTGHSLGAGCAAILSFMMRSKYPTLRCHCYCPPGCTMSENMADRCRDYVTSYVFDHDIVPRLTLDSMDHFRDDIFELIARVKVSKRDAVQANADALEQELMFESGKIPPSRYYHSLELFHQHQESIRNKRDKRSVRLFPPGQIVHLVRTAEPALKPTGCCGGRAADSQDDEIVDRPLDYAARWGHRSDFAEIVISSHMVSDHSAPNMLKELKATAEQFGFPPPFRVQRKASHGDGEQTP